MSQGKEVTRVRAKKKPRSHITYFRECKKVWGSMREWTLTLPRQLPLWEMESRWTPKISKSNFRGQNSMACGVLYIIGKLLKLRCLNELPLLIWTSETQVMTKRRVGSQIASLTPDQKKLGINPIYLATEDVRHTVRKLLMRTTTLLQTASWSKVWSQNYGAPKSRRSQLARFRDSHSGVPGEKNHLDVGSVASHKVYYKGEGGGFPQVRAMVSLVCPCCPWLVLTPKVLQLCTNHLVWVVCKPVWVNETCQLFLDPSRSSNTPLYPSKCCELGSVPQLLPFPLSSTWTHIWVLQGVGSASKPMLADFHLLWKLLILVLKINFKNQLNVYIYI
jgi:hypothetical protein